jgi:hypothetical protein
MVDYWRPDRESCRRELAAGSRNCQARLRSPRGRKRALGPALLLIGPDERRRLEEAFLLADTTRCPAEHLGQFPSETSTLMSMLDALLCSSPVTLLVLTGRRRPFGAASPSAPSGEAAVRSSLRGAAGAEARAGRHLRRARNQQSPACTVLDDVCARRRINRDLKATPCPSEG